ncbi:circadian clock protein PASD1 isoform X2 [Erinaceus europaeus]|uniref:Circadian clock protein PASD1 isoform X2 n=1 Tax=Erinaceus europaeus TaxID=9365 RepID=A0ABM3WSL0_ERIEU|nr:circadian clock protein PASD1 isoform X2 [Erinaceus europaeus]
MLQRSSYCVTEAGAEAPQAATDPGQEEEATTSTSVDQPQSSQSCKKVASKTPKGSRSKGKQPSRKKSGWIPPFRSYEDFIQVALQSLDGTMLILTTNGVIVFVDKSIFYLLGHLPGDVIGRTLLSFLPDGEKSRVYRRISLRLPLPNLVGEHIEFCCHIQRGNVENSSDSNYEFVKIFLNVIDIANEPQVLFASFFPSHCVEPAVENLPLEDRFYLVGTMCVLKSQMLQEMFTSAEPSGESTQKKRKSTFSESSSSTRRKDSRAKMEAIRLNLAAAVSQDQVTSEDRRLLELQGSADIVKMRFERSEMKSDSNSDSSGASLETTSTWPALPRVQHFGGTSGPEIQWDNQSQVCEVGSLEDEEALKVVEASEDVLLAEEVETREEVEPKEKAQLQGNMQLQEVGQPLEEMQTQEDIPTQGEMEKQEEMQTLEEMQTQEEFQTQGYIQRQGEMQTQGPIQTWGAAEQVRRPPGVPAEEQPNSSSSDKSPELPKLDPVPRKSRLGKTKKSFSSVWVAKRFRASSPYSPRSPEESEEPCKSSTELPALEAGPQRPPSPETSQNPAELPEELDKPAYMEEEEEEGQPPAEP